MFREVPNNIKIIKSFILLTFIACWFSISTSFEDILNLINNDQFDYKILINFLRHISVYFCLFFLILIFFIFREKINFKKYFIFYFLIGYFLAQLIGLFVTNNLLSNISFIISSITIILTIILIDSFFLDNEKKYFLFISFVILGLVFFLTFTPLFLNFLNGGSIYGGFYTSDIFMDKISPRSSGLARMALLILIFIEFFEINYFKNHSTKAVFFKIMFITFICLFQSRTIFFLTILVYSIIFINKNKLKLNLFLKFISIYLIIPTILFFSLSALNSYKFRSVQYSIDSKDKSFLGHLNSNELKIFRNMSEGDISSGRFNDWQKILDNISGKNIIYGFGAQGDRYLIKQSASSGFIYAYSSSGIIGLSFFILFLIMMSIRIIKILLYHFRDNVSLILFCLILSSLSLRAVLETSFAVFSIDLIVVTLALSFIFDKNIKIKDIKNKYSK